MPWFQIEPDWAGAGKRRVKVSLEAATWMEALQLGAEKLRPGKPLRDVQVEFLSGGVTVVRDGSDGFALRLTEVDGPARARALEEPSTIRETPALTALPRLAPGKSYVTYTRPRAALKPPESPALPASARPSAPVASAQARSARPDAAAAARRGPAEPEASSSARQVQRAPAAAPAAGELPATRMGRPAGRSSSAPTFRLSPELLARVKKCCWMGVNRRMFEGLLELALELVPSESGAAFRHDVAEGELELVAAWGPRAQRLMASGLVLLRGQGVAGAAAEQRVLVLEANAPSPAKNAVAAPIVSSNAVLGVLELSNRKGGGPFTDADAMKLSQLARAASGFLEGTA